MAASSSWYDSLGETLGGAWDGIADTTSSVWDSTAKTTGELWDEATAGAKDYAKAWTTHEVDKLKSAGQENNRTEPAVQPSGQPVAPSQVLQPTQRKTWLMVGGVITVTIIVLLLLFLLLK